MIIRQINDSHATNAIFVELAKYYTQPNLPNFLELQKMPNNVILKLH